MKKITKPAQKSLKPAKAVKVAPASKTAVVKPVAPAKAKPAPDPVVQQDPAIDQHVPGQVEETAPVPQEHPEIPAEGNNIACVRDRAFADTHPANFQPPVEKTFVSPKD